MAWAEADAGDIARALVEAMFGEIALRFPGGPDGYMSAGDAAVKDAELTAGALVVRDLLARQYQAALTSSFGPEVVGADQWQAATKELHQPT